VGQLCRRMNLTLHTSQEQTGVTRLLLGLNARVTPRVEPVVQGDIGGEATKLGSHPAGYVFGGLVSCQAG
jgi:hypothetical protein